MIGNGCDYILHKNRSKTLLTMSNIKVPLFEQYNLCATIENGWTDQYGAIPIIAEYAHLKLPPKYFVKGFWQHGCEGPWVDVASILINNILYKHIPIYVARKDQEKLLIAQGFSNSRAIGLPIVYTPSANLKRQTRSLLIMPTHTLRGSSFFDRSPFESYANEIQVASEGFDKVVVCVHPSCHENGLWTKEFSSRGFEVIFGALNYDRYALSRMRALFEQFEVVSTNGWGSHVAYALAYGAKVSIYGTQPKIRREDYLRDTSWSANPADLDCMLSEGMALREREYLQSFMRPPLEAVADVERGQWLIGADCKISPDEMKGVFYKLLGGSVTDSPQNNLESKNSSAHAVSSSASNIKKILRETLTCKNSNCNVSGKRILIFSDDPGQGGVAHHGHSLITALLKAGAKVFSAQPEMRSPLLDEQRLLGAEIIWTGYNPSKEFLRSAEDEADAERIMVSAQPDLVIFNDSCVMSHIAAKNFAIQNLLPFISICNTDTEYLALRFPKLMPAVEKHFCFAQQVVAVSESVLTTLRRAFALPGDKGVVVYYGRPERFFEAPGESVRAELRKELGVPADAVLCLTTARMVADKGYQFQFEAIKKLKTSGRMGNLYFAWAGDGDLRTKFVELVKNAGLQDRVKVLGYRWDVDNLMSASDIFVLPSLVEAMPLSIMEAMAKGMPVMASAIAGVPEELGSTGCLLPDPGKEPEQTISKLVETLSSWASDVLFRKKLGLDSHERAKLFFREEVMASRMVPLIASAAVCKNRELAVRKANLMSRSAEMNDAFEKYRRSTEGAGISKAEQELVGFESDEINTFEQVIKAFQANPTNASSKSQLADLRKGLADYLLGVQPSDLKSLMSGSFGKVFDLILNSGLQDEQLISEELEFAESLVGGFDADGQFDIRRLIASMLFWRAHGTAALLAVELIPSWFFENYINYLIFSPEAFQEIGDAELYRKHIHNVLSESWRRIQESPRSPLSMKLSQVIASRLNLIPLYFNEQGNKNTYILRSKFIGHFLESRGLKLEETGQKTSSARKRIKVGFLNAHFTSQTETYTTIPTFSHLDRTKFEVVLYCLGSLGGPLENFCRNCADTFVVLPQALDEQINEIRGDKLDALVIGTNVTAVTNQAALLASARLAPVQLINNSSPVTSGMPHVDGYLSGTFLVDDKSDEEYSEKLCLLDGPSHCFNYEVDRREPVVNLDRAGLGISQDAVVYFSGANCFKIIPEMQEAWARILAKVPGSVLLLHPFNPNWASQYPVRRFERNMLAAFARHGVDANRLVLSRERLPSRSDVLELIKLSDIYLDSFPFAGVNSAVDPLEVGIPLVACEMQTFRSRMAASLLRELKIEELIASGEQDYIDLASKLGLDSSYRAEVSQKIVSAMGQNPRFLDSAAYSANMGRIIESLVGRSLPEAMPKNRDFTIQDAQTAFAEGRLSDSEDICREILAKDERCAGAWHLMGKMAALQGDIETASEFASVACDLDPQNADFMRELAEVFLRKKELEPAEKEVRRALEMAPDSPEGLVLLGRILAEKDDKSASFEAFQDALRLRKDYAEGFSHYATALQKFGRGKDAISQIRKACALEPDSVEFQTNLAILLEQNARYVDALAAYGKAVRMNPNVGFVWFRQGKLLNGLKRYAESIPALAKAISLPGQLGDYYYEYGLALHMSKRFQEALVHYEKALSMGYNTAALQCNRGVIYKDLRKGGDAIMAFHAAVKMDPSNVSYLNNLGAAALELGLNTEALECFEQAVEKNPMLPTARNNIGNLLKDRARGMDALPQYRKSMELNPDDRDAPSNYLLCHMYIPDMDPKLVFEEHKKWGISTTKKFPPAFKFKPREAGAKIRVGFLSADLCHHPVAHFIEPIFRGYDRECFEVVAYGDQRKSDEFSARFAKQVDLWRETSSYDDRALAKLIHEDRVDILFELAGHTAYNRLGVFALKPAPVQVSYLGYPGTTGLPTIDFRITDAFADPLGATEHLHTEKLIRVPECAWCFEPDASAPEVEPLPALKNGYVTFGCFNNMAKLNPSLFETWAEILLRVPGSHLRLKARTLTDDGVRKELKSYFTERGIEEDRLDFFGHTKKVADHLNHYHSVDIALDSFPYHGTTTTCEAMWMGCPVVTRSGKTHVSRVGVSLLSAVGLQEFITDTREAYIEKAVALAAQTDRLQELRSGMRDRLRNSVLMDEKRFVQGFEKALMEMANLGGLMRP